MLSPTECTNMSVRKNINVSVSSTAITNIKVNE